MDTDFRLFPEQASSGASAIDHLYFYLLTVTTFFVALIFLCVIVFSMKYRRRPGRETGAQVRTSLRLEIVWIAVPFILVLIMFFWGASVYFPLYRSPSNALDVYVVGRQWMWKLQHAEGASEINELHVPVGRPIRLTMTSEDVIHSFFVPAFRLKQDVLPGRYSTLWFEPTRVGEYRLFCAEYCGTKHSGMVGRVVVMTPADYERWLEGSLSPGTLASGGQRLFLSLGCTTCHQSGPAARGPNLAGLYGSRVRLQDGSEIVADESYLRESILDPTAKIVSGFQPVMPSFRGRVSEEELIRLVAYLKSPGVPTPTVRDR
jgi:cytochrome c oxidase subunit II